MVSDLFLPNQHLFPVKRKTILPNPLPCNSFFHKQHLIISLLNLLQVCMYRVRKLVFLLFIPKLAILH